MQAGCVIGSDSRFRLHNGLKENVQTFAAESSTVSLQTTFKSCWNMFRINVTNRRECESAESRRDYRWWLLNGLLMLCL